MKPLHAFPHRYQSGSASLLVTLVLCMLATMVILTATRTWLSEQKMAANSRWHTRLSYEAYAGWSHAVAYLVENHETIRLRHAKSQGRPAKADTLTSANKDIQSGSLLFPLGTSSRFFDIQTTSVRNDQSGLSAAYKQSVRLLTLLAPYAESPAPLILNGCITAMANGFDIRPLLSDTDKAGEAIRLYSAKPCSGLDTVDVHDGHIAIREPVESLWSTVFSVSRETFLSMARAEANLPDRDRRYWLAEKTDFTGGRWTRSLGYPARPVALLFSSATGCPDFSDGVRIFGVVFIDADCGNPIASGRLEIVGALVVNGNLNASGAMIRLKHIHLSDNQLKILNFPVLRAVRIPGSWRDF